MKITCIAIDDEPLALKKIEGFVAKVSSLVLLKTFNNAIDGMQYLKSNSVDLLFLDIEMEDLSGIELLGLLKSSPLVILTTAYEEYALKGYEFDVVDYLLKPFSFQRFLASVEKAGKFISSSQKTEGQRRGDKVFVKSGDKFENISLDSIYYIEGMKDYLRIHTTGKKVMVLMTFKSIEELLDPDCFIRIHKSFIVAIDKIERVENRIVTIADQRISVGETYRKRFFELFDRYRL